MRINLSDFDLFYKLASGEISFFVDWDETLAHYWTGPEDFIPDNIEYFPLVNDKFILKRPEADEFLSKLKKIGKVYLCSHGTSNYVNECIKLMKWGKYFDDIFTRENILSKEHFKPLCVDFILIDNLPEHSDNTQKKINFISGRNYMPSQNYIQIPDFIGDPDNILSEVFIKINQILSSFEDN